MSPHTALDGKTALITGAARRIDRAVAHALHGAGANVVLHYRSSADIAAELADKLNGVRPGSAVLAECDLLETRQLSALAVTAVQAFGRLDILINNASTFYPTPADHITDLKLDPAAATASEETDSESGEESRLRGVFQPPHQPTSNSARRGFPDRRATLELQSRGASRGRVYGMPTA